jgi:hypothetical protein
MPLVIETGINKNIGGWVMFLQKSRLTFSLRRLYKKIPISLPWPIISRKAFHGT